MRRARKVVLLNNNFANFASDLPSKAKAKEGFVNFAVIFSPEPNHFLYFCISFSVSPT